MIIKVAEEFTDTPGGRYKANSKYSGEQFREELLFPKYLACLELNEKLLVDLDGGYGYPIGFLEEAFGGLIKMLKDNKLSSKKALKIIKIKSNDEVSLVDKIYTFMKKEIKNNKK